MAGDAYTISLDRDRVDVGFVHRWLSEKSYWAPKIPRAIVEESIRNSLCVSAFSGDSQVGFARVITDYATYGYLADVFVVEEHRGRGVSKLMMQALMSHPPLGNLRRWQLVTRDAHRLYERFGFTTVEHPERQMELVRKNAYSE